MESGYYPPGAEHDPRAPYNQPGDPDPIEVEVSISTSLSKSDTINVTDYYNEGDEGGVYANFSNTDFNMEFEADGHKSPKELLDILAEIALDKATNCLKERNVKDHNYWIGIYNDAINWTEDELEVIKE